MKDSLVRFGVAMESSLVEQLDALAAARGGNRSELLRDLVRAEVSRTGLQGAVPAVASVTLIYNHHVRELSDRLTSLQHALGEQVRSAMHVHLDHDHCIEVIVLRGRANELKATAERMLGTRGVLHGGAQYAAESMLALAGHHHHDEHSKDHHAEHAHGHEHAPDRSRTVKLTKTRRTTKRTG